MSKIKVLVIDDAQILRQLIHTTFGSHEYEMQIAHQQQDIDDLQYLQPDILILNLSHRDSQALLTSSVVKQLSEYDQLATFRCAELEVDFTKRSVHFSGESVHLTPTEYDLLTYFIQNQGKVLSHDDLLETVREDTRVHSTHLMRVHISNLRQKIEKDTSVPRFIQTVPGIGYRFVGCDE